VTSDEMNGPLDSWNPHLRAERKSVQTVKTYADDIRRFLAWVS
jgi:integrase/recombinase XerD